MQNKAEIYGFLDNLILICNGKFSLSLGEYLFFPVNVLTSSPKITDRIENKFF